MSDELKKISNRPPPYNPDFKSITCSSNGMSSNSGMSSNRGMSSNGGMSSNSGMSSNGGMSSSNVIIQETAQMEHILIPPSPFDDHADQHKSNHMSLEGYRNAVQNSAKKGPAQPPRALPRKNLPKNIAVNNQPTVKDLQQTSLGSAADVKLVAADVKLVAASADYHLERNNNSKFSFDFEQAPQSDAKRPIQLSLSNNIATVEQLSSRQPLYPQTQHLPNSLAYLHQQSQQLISSTSQPNLQFNNSSSYGSQPYQQTNGFTSYAMQPNQTNLNEAKFTFQTNNAPEIQPPNSQNLSANQLPKQPNYQHSDQKIVYQQPTNESNGQHFNSQPQYILPQPQQISQSEIYNQNVIPAQQVFYQQPNSSLGQQQWLQRPECGDSNKNEATWKHLHLAPMVAHQIVAKVPEAPMDDIFMEDYNNQMDTKYHNYLPQKQSTALYPNLALLLPEAQSSRKFSASCLPSEHIPQERTCLSMSDLLDTDVDNRYPPNNLFASNNEFASNNRQMSEPNLLDSNTFAAFSQPMLQSPANTLELGPQFLFPSVYTGQDYNELEQTKYNIAVPAQPAPLPTNTHIANAIPTNQASNSYLLKYPTHISLSSTGRRMLIIDPDAESNVHLFTVEGQRLCSWKFDRATGCCFLHADEVLVVSGQVAVALFNAEGHLLQTISPPVFPVMNVARKCDTEMMLITKQRLLFYIDSSNHGIFLNHVVCVKSENTKGFLRKKTNEQSYILDAACRCEYIITLITYDVALSDPIVNSKTTSSYKTEAEKIQQTNRIKGTNSNLKFIDLKNKKSRNNYGNKDLDCSSNRSPLSATEKFKSKYYIFVLDKLGSPLNKIDLWQAALEHAFSLAVDAKNNFYVSDCSKTNGKVARFSNKGQYNFIYGRSNDNQEMAAKKTVDVSTLNSLGKSADFAVFGLALSQSKLFAITHNINEPQVKIYTTK